MPVVFILSGRAFERDASANVLWIHTRLLPSIASSAAHLGLRRALRARFKVKVLTPVLQLLKRYARLLGTSASTRSLTIH
jgi:hypothetical protein